MYNILMSFKKTVLIIDDEQDILEVLTTFIDEDIHCILKVQNAKDAIELIKKNVINLIICDFKMPDMNGLELLQYLHDCKNETPFIFFSGVFENKLYDQAKQLGCVDLIQKGSFAELKILKKYINNI